MKQYKVLKPIGYGGRKEKGEILSLPEEVAKAIGSEFLEEVSSANTVKEEVVQEEKPLEKFSKAELEAKAEELGLDSTGSKADLLERITLHLEEEQA